MDLATLQQSPESLEGWHKQHPLRVQPKPDTLPFDYVSRRNAARLRAAGSPLALRGGLRIVTDARSRAGFVHRRHPRGPLP